jgi:siroheme synthase
MNKTTLGFCTLAAAGLAAMPAAVIERGTTVDERSVVDCVGGIAEAARAAGLGSPALIVIGEVVRMARSSERAQPLRRQA